MAEEQGCIVTLHPSSLGADQEPILCIVPKARTQGMVGVLIWLFTPTETWRANCQQSCGGVRTTRADGSDELCEHTYTK